MASVKTFITGDPLLTYFVLTIASRGVVLMLIGGLAESQTPRSNSSGSSAAVTWVVVAAVAVAKRLSRQTARDNAPSMSSDGRPFFKAWRQSTTVAERLKEKGTR